MTMFRVGPAGIPGSLKTDMNTVLNKKFGTTGQDYPPADWPADVNLLGPLPIIISNKAPIVSFNDGADDVPIESGTFYVVPTQAGTGTPSPSNPRAISGYTGMTISHAKNLLLPNPTDSSASTTNGVTRSYSATTQEFTLSGTNEKTDSAWLIANWSSETIVGLKEGATYTFSHNLSNNCYSQITYYKKDGTTGTLVSLNGNADKDASTTFVVPSDYDRPRNFQIGIFRTAITVDEQAHFMINGGTTAFPFSKYVTPETLAVSWQTEAGTVYGGELNVTTGVLTATWGEVDLGNLSWTYNASYLAFYATVTDKKNGSNGYIDIYERTTYWITSQEWADANNVFYCSGGNKYLAIKNTDYSNAATFKTAMTGHKFIFELDTPVTYQITAHPELSTYYGNNNFYCDTGDSQLNYRADISLYINNH